MKEAVIRTRILTALIALPLLIVLVLHAGSGLFNGVIVLVSMLGLREFLAMLLPKERSLERSIALSFGTLFAVCVCWQQPHSALLVLVAVLLLLAIVFLCRFRDLETVIQQLAMTLFGLLYVPLLLGHIALLRGLEDGRAWVFLALIVAMVGDSAAYFVGSAFGRRKLYPAISPNKSIEGALGGVAGSVAGALAFKLLFLPQANGWFVLFLGVTLAILGQLGDLFESMLKRSAGVKDSGALIPGHGGVLDRLDSLLFVFPALYYFIFFFG